MYQNTITHTYTDVVARALINPRCPTATERGERMRRRDDPNP